MLKDGSKLTQYKEMPFLPGSFEFHKNNKTLEYYRSLFYLLIKPELNTFQVLDKISL